MDRRNLKIYEIATAIVWSGLFASVALILSGSRHLMATSLVLAAGAVFFLLILPGALYLKGRPGGSPMSHVDWSDGSRTGQHQVRETTEPSGTRPNS
jgi:hypothetical protein